MNKPVVKVTGLEKLLFLPSAATLLACTVYCVPGNKLFNGMGCPAGRTEVEDSPVSEFVKRAWTLLVTELLFGKV